jgi:hypothetical protein
MGMKVHMPTMMYGGDSTGEYASILVIDRIFVENENVVHVLLEEIRIRSLYTGRKCRDELLFGWCWSSTKIIGRYATVEFQIP